MVQVIDTATTDKWLIDKSNRTWVLAATGSITVNRTAIWEDKDQSGNTIELRGSISFASKRYFSTGLEVDGKGTEVVVYDTATFNSQDALEFGGQSQSLLNYGTINGSFDSILAFGTNFRFVNYGAVTGEMMLTNGNFINRPGATVSGIHAIITSFGAGSVDITNQGTITGHAAIYANKGDHGPVDVTNDGRIVGDVKLGPGSDRIVFNPGSYTHGDTTGGLGYDTLVIRHGAHIHGYVTGGDGDDTYDLLGRSPVHIAEREGEGVDTVRSTFSYQLPWYVERLHLMGNRDINGTGADLALWGERLYGNAGDNILNGLKGDDILNGGAGNDTLIGGEGPDRFIFKQGYGVDTVEDFQGHGDRIVLRGLDNIHNVSDLPLSQHGKDVWITLDDQDIMILKNVQASQLTNHDFQWT